MEQSKDALDVIELQELFDKINEEGMVKDPNSTGGPGVVSRKTKNDYTRQEVSDLLQYASKFVKAGKQIQSFPFEQKWLNQIGSTMKEFMNLRKGDPALDYKEGEMQGDHHAKSYGGHSGNKADKGKASSDLKGGGPGPVRGSEMKKEYNPNK